MLHQIIIDSAVGILLVVGMIIAWNFPNPIGEHDTVKSKIGFNASFEFDILIASTIFYITSLVCHYWRPNNPINKVIHSIADTCVSTSVILVFIIATESLYLSGGDDMLSNKIFAKFDNDTDREAQMMFWVALLLVSFSQISFTYQGTILETKTVTEQKRQSNAFRQTGPKERSDENLFF